MSEVTPVLTVVEGLWPEGAKSVQADILRGTQPYDLAHSVLSLHDQTDRDGHRQFIEVDASYTALNDAGVAVQALKGRLYGAEPSPRPMSDPELAVIATHMEESDGVIWHEDSPLRLIRPIVEGGVTVPGSMVSLFRTQPDTKSAGFQGLQWAIQQELVQVCTVDSEAGRAQYEAAGISASNLRVIPNGIDLDRFRPSPEDSRRVRDDLRILWDAPVVLSVTRDSPEKNIPLFLASARAYLEQEATGHVMAVGAGMDAQNPALMHQIRAQFDEASPLLDRLHLLGKQSDMGAIQAAATVITLTSEVESYPLSLIEGLSSGAVGVSTDVGDVAEIFDDGRHGLITAPNPEAVAAAWVEAYARRQELVVSPAARERFGQDRMYKAYAALMIELRA
jgi:glycosyltransferase involved in cell wall biosynthesis